MSDSDSDLDVRNSAVKLQSKIASSGVRAGLVQGHEVKDMLTASRNARREVLLNSGDAGRDAAPVHRVGMKVVSKAEFNESRLRADPAYKRQRRKEIDAEFERTHKSEWRSGLEQSTERMARAEENLSIADESFSKYLISNEFEKTLKTQHRWEDPMVSSNANKCKFQAPSNRFGIQAGYRWDGVVRGNDFEQRWFESVNDKKSKSNDSYKYQIDL